MVKFDLNQWKDGSPELSMVRKQPCQIGEGVLGIMYNYEPVVPTANGMQVVRPGEYIKKTPSGDYEVVLPN